jgi:hypothetical protein
MKQNHPNIKILYIPVGCMFPSSYPFSFYYQHYLTGTGKFQPADVGLQCVIKHHIWCQCMEFLAVAVESEIHSGQNPSNITLPDSLKQL